MSTYFCDTPHGYRGGAFCVNHDIVLSGLCDCILCSFWLLSSRVRAVISPLYAKYAIRTTRIVLNRCVSLLPSTFCLHVPKRWIDVLRLAPPTVTTNPAAAVPDKCTENRELGNALLQEKMTKSFLWMQVCSSVIRLHAVVAVFSVASSIAFVYSYCIVLSTYSITCVVIA